MRGLGFAKSGSTAALQRHLSRAASLQFLDHQNTSCVSCSRYFIFRAHIRSFQGISTTLICGVGNNPSIGAKAPRRNPEVSFFACVACLCPYGSLPTLTFDNTQAEALRSGVLSLTAKFQQAGYAPSSSSTVSCSPSCNSENGLRVPSNSKTCLVCSLRTWKTTVR